jgi:hypothetical protein
MNPADATAAATNAASLAAQRILKNPTLIVASVSSLVSVVSVDR